MIRNRIMIDPNKVPHRRQLEVLQFVHGLTKQLGHEPRIAEINAALGMAPGRGVLATLLTLEEKGLIEFGENERRGGVKVTRGSIDVLTPRQTEARDAARDLRRELGRSPLIAEIAERLGIEHPATTRLCVELEAKGAVTFEGRPTRGPVRITKEGKQWL
jgi:SOS-response transcriptional repressor LexA